MFTAVEAKKLTDTYLHDEGEKVLIKLGREIQQRAGQGEYAYQWDDYCTPAVLPLVVEALKQAGYSCVKTKNSYSGTISYKISWAEVTPEDEADPEQFENYPRSH